MIFALNCKRMERDGNKWINYSTKKDGKWYSFRFVRDCVPPKPHKICEGVAKAFIDLDDSHVWNISEKGGYLYLYVESYADLKPEALELAIRKERENIEKFREQKEKEKKNFITPIDDEDLPF